MGIIYYKNRTLNYGKPVEIYRCLNRKGKVYSIKQDNYVRAHSDRLYIFEPSLKIIKSQKERSIRTGERNVHAFIQGYLIRKKKIQDYTSDYKLYYDPYSKCGFQFVDYDRNPKPLGKLAYNIDKIVINSHGVNLFFNLGKKELSKL